jgi:hypothetical protein
VAGLGRKVFVAGEILQAAELQGYAVDQSVMVFDDATARTAAIPSPTEGMVTYLKDEDAVTVYDGAVFRRVGGLVAVKEAIKTDTFSASVTSSSNAAVTGLSITHEVQDPTNRLIISAFFGTSASSVGAGNIGVGVAQDGTLIGIGAADGSRTRVGAGGIVSPSSASAIASMPSISFVHTPGAGSKIYTVRAINIRTATATLYVNRSEQDSNTADFARSISALVIQEVAV